MALNDTELKRIAELERRLVEIEKEFHCIKLDDVKKLESYLADEGPVYSAMYARVGPPKSAARKRIAKDAKSWFKDLSYQTLMRIKNTNLIRVQVTSRKYQSTNSYRQAIAEATERLNAISLKGWSDSLFSRKPNRSEYDRQITYYEMRIEQYKKWIKEHGPYVDLLEKILDIADKYETEIFKIDKLVKEIKSEANARTNRLAMESKLAKAARVDESVRSQVSRFRRTIKKTSECPYCLLPIGSEPHLDHIYPVSKGGLNIAENLVYCCMKCNSNKSDKGLRQFCIEFGLDYLKVTERLAAMGKHV
jgi:5-methylcytosine-specific restriction endonuclease McrA